MKNVVFVASHLGYRMDRTPLGGGAMVGLQLVRHWAGAPGVHLTVLGSGSHPPAPGVTYLQLPACREDPDLVRLSEREYAAFCRGFEAATTGHILGRRETFDPRRTVIVVNDISEGPDFTRLGEAGYPIVSVWHVDVVEFFNRIYLRDVVRPERLTSLFRRLRRRGLAGMLPDILRLVFEKQAQAVEHSDLLVLPSRQMAEAIRCCYADAPSRGKPPLDRRTLVLPWGGWGEEVPEERVGTEAARLKAHYQIGPGTRVVMTLSRISPEKGIHLLLEALRGIESRAEFAGKDVCLFVCGEPAFMRGEAYARRVRREAAKLGRFRVFFPGYLSAFDKQVYFRLAELFVSPSLHESYGLTLVEAMRAGLPVLASDHYGVDEILAPSYGVKVPYRRPAERASRLGEALAALLSNPDRLRSMGERARTAAGRMTFSGAARSLLDAALGMAAEGS